MVQDNTQICLIKSFPHLLTVVSLLGVEMLQRNKRPSLFELSMQDDTKKITKVSYF